MNKILKWVSVGCLGVALLLLSILSVVIFRSDIGIPAIIILLIASIHGLAGLVIALIRKDGTLNN